MTAERPRQPKRRHDWGYLERLVLVLLVCAAFAAGSGTAGASHGAGKANYTVEVLGGPSPGAAEVRYGCGSSAGRASTSRY